MKRGALYYHFRFGRGGITFKDVCRCQVLVCGWNTKHLMATTFFFEGWNYEHIWGSIVHFVQKESKAFWNAFDKQRSRFRKWMKRRECNTAWLLCHCTWMGSRTPLTMLKPRILTKDSYSQELVLTPELNNSWRHAYLALVFWSWCSSSLNIHWHRDQKPYK